MSGDEEQQKKKKASAQGSSSSSMAALLGGHCHTARASMSGSGSSGEVTCAPDTSSIACGQI